MLGETSHSRTLLPSFMILGTHPRYVDHTDFRSLRLILWSISVMDLGQRTGIKRDINVLEAYRMLNAIYSWWTNVVNGFI